MKFKLLREGIHQPADPYSDEQKCEKCPQSVFRALRGAAFGKKCECDGDNKRKKQQRSKMGKVAKQQIHPGSPPRPISYASSTVRRLSMPAAANRRVP